MKISRSELSRIVVAIDPAVTATEDSDDTGIIVCARGPHQSETCQIPFCPGHGFVLADETCHVLPADWARIAVDAFDGWQADRIVAETNNGGDMVGTVIHAIRAGVPYSKVTATRGKRTRAEPVSALWEQGRCHLLGEFPELEAEMNTWTPETLESPNRVDALVWGMTYLGLVGGQGDAFLTAWKDEIANRGPGTPPELRDLPRHTHEEVPAALKPGCKHRWWIDNGVATCVFCSGVKGDEE